MLFWARTPDGWAVNLDGSNAGREYSLPRIELHSGARGWTGVCRLPDGTSQEMTLANEDSAPAAKRAAVGEALLVLGAQYEMELQSLQSLLG